MFSVKMLFYLLKKPLLLHCIWLIMLLFKIFQFSHQVEKFLSCLVYKPFIITQLFSNRSGKSLKALQIWNYHPYRPFIANINDTIPNERTMSTL